MTLDRNEKAIIAAFRTMDQAQKAMRDLKALGVIDQSVDRMSMYPVTDLEERRHNPITGNYPGLASSTFDHEMNRDASVMASVNPSASGMSDGEVSEVGKDVVLTVVIPKNKYDQAEQIVKEYGGDF